MSRKKDTVRMWVARNSGGWQEYIISFNEIDVITHLSKGEEWFGAKYGRHQIIDPKIFRKTFNFYLRPGAKPRLVEFPKIAMKAVKK